MNAATLSTQRFKGTLALLLLTLATAGCHTVPRPSAVQAPTRETQQNLTPTAALDRLVAGNERYVQGKSSSRNWANERAATAQGQFPYAVVLSCLDSRTSAEVIFDQGHGEIFNARVAGNILNDDILGSMEFACKVAGAKLIAVVGHTECGAVKGACAGAQLGHLTGLLDRIRPAIEATHLDSSEVTAAKPRAVEAVTLANVHLVMSQIREQSPILRELLDAGQLGLVGGIYDLESGAVKFLKP